MDSKAIQISPKSVVLTIIFVIILIAAWQVRQVFLALFVAYIFANGLAPISDFFEKKGLPKILAVGSTFILALGVVSLIISLAVPPLIGEIREFATNFPVYFQRAIDVLHNNNLQLVTSQNIGTMIYPRIGEAASSFLSVAAGAINFLVFLISIVVFTFYLLLERKGLKENLYLILPNMKKERVTNLANKLENKLGSWLRGELYLMFVVGTETFIGLSILHVNYALPLAIIAGLLEAFPMIGPILSAVPAVIVAFVQNPVLGLAVVALYILVQQLENYLLVPKVMERAVGVSPIIVLSAIFVGGAIFGVIGALISLPAVGLIQIIIEDYSVSNQSTV